MRDSDVKLRPLLAGLTAAGLICGGAAGTAMAVESQTPKTAALAVEVRAEPATAAGLDPFTPSAAGSPAEVTPIRAGGVVSGDTPGLYGGTLQNACDSAAMVGFLRDNPDRAAAFAASEGIAPESIGDYVNGLTPVTLRADTSVTNHGFANGRATAFPAVLQVGTAVLVDEFGVPQVRCYCGNPLDKGSDEPATYTGATWEGLSEDHVSVITPAAAPEHAAVKGQTEPVPVEQEPHHRWIFENQYVRVLDVVLAPGESTLFHTHSHDSIAVRLTDAAVQEQPFNKEWRPASRLLPGDSRYMKGTPKPYTHRAKNVGSTPFHVIDIELLVDN